MHRLLPFLAAASLALPFASGCVVRTYNPPPRYVVTEYRYYGEHPVPGGGWCHLDGVHLHPFAPEYQYYAYADGYYRYSGPTVVWYYDFHPFPGGGYCHLHGRHAHNFGPGAAYASAYYWDAGRSGYVYNGSGYHGATAAPGYRPPPPPPANYQHPAQPAAPPPGATYAPPPPAIAPQQKGPPPVAPLPKPGSPSARGNDPGHGVADPPRPDAAPAPPPPATPGNAPGAPPPPGGERRDRKIDNEHTERMHPNE